MIQTFGDYTLKEKIADGGMAEVFKGLKKGPLGFKKTVVLKKLLPYYCDREDFIKMLSDEARISSKLCHPNIVRTYDFLKVNNSYLLEMEYVNGRDLSQIMARARSKGYRIDPECALLIISEVLEGLSYAHKTIIHRDISPQNILISYAGEVKIADFGIALHPEKESRTRNGELKGKANYMPPEQIKRQKMDQRADIFAAGVVLHELITGSKPFERQTEYETLRAIAEDGDPEITLEGLCCKKGLIRILRRSLAKDRKRRFLSASQFQHEISMLLEAGKKRNVAYHLGKLMNDLFPKQKRTHIKIEKTPFINDLPQPHRGSSINLFTTFILAALILTLPSNIQIIPAKKIRAASTVPGLIEKKYRSGSISVNSHPWSRIYINGKEMGETPMNLEDLEPGVYVLNMVFPSGHNRIRKFAIKEGRQTVIFEKLSKK